MPGISEWLIIFGIAILFFGGKKLPELGRAVGESIKNFKKGIHDEEVEQNKPRKVGD
jgi:sec-independent protein translocase protein TatA